MASSSAYDGTVTLIFYRMNKDRRKEPLLNQLAAFATGSQFTHVEMAIGEELSNDGLMRNVVRIFNDRVGVEVTERTGINPSFSYMSIACPKRAELAMLAFSKQQVGKPFSMIGMARSVCWPRKTTCKDWYCAELVAAVMQVGGLIDAAYNPGAATPENLYRRFHGKFATAANPFVLNKLSSSSSSVSSRSSRSCSTAVATALTAASTPGRLQPVKWHGHAQRMNVSQLSAAEQQQQSASTMFAISPWQLKMDAPKSALGTQDELEPLMKHRIGYRVTTAGGAAGGAAGGGHVYRGRTNTAESIRCAVLRAGVLSHPQADLSMGGLYDRV